jgi:hypothetical protein
MADLTPNDLNAIAKLNSEQMEKMLEKLPDAFAKALRASKSSSTGDLKYSAADLDTSEIARQLKRYTKELKDGQPWLKTFKDTLGGTIPGLRGLKNFEEAIEDLNEQITEATENIKAGQNVETNERRKKEAEAKKTQTETAKREAEKLAWHETSKVATAGVAVAFGKFANGLIKSDMMIFDAQMEMASGLIAGKAANDLYTDSVVAMIKANNEFTRGLTDGVGALGQLSEVLALAIPGGKLLKIGLAVLGSALSFGATQYQRYADRQAELAEKGERMLNQLFTDVKDGFKGILKSGGNLSMGMTDLYDLTIKAGMSSVKEFAASLSESRESIRMTGMGYDEAANKIAGVSGQLRKSVLGFGKQLDYLGYTLPEQVGLVADTMAAMHLAGNQQIRDDKEVARLTAQYGRDLRVLQEITEGDVREKLREAQKKAMDPSLRAQAQAEGGAEGLQRITGILEQMPQVLKGGLDQQLEAVMSSKGKIAAGGVGFQEMYANVPAFKKFVDASLKLQHDSSVTTAEEGGLRLRKLAEDMRREILTSEQSKAYLQQQSGRLPELFTAGKMGNAGAQNMYEARKGLMETILPIGEGQADKAKNTVGTMGQGQGNLDKTYANAVENAQEQGVKQLAAMKTPLNNFATAMGSVTTSLKNFQSSLESVTAYMNNKFGSPATQQPPLKPGESASKPMKTGAGVDKKAADTRLPSNMIRPDGTTFNPYLQNQSGGSTFDSRDRAAAATGFAGADTGKPGSADPMSLIKFGGRTGDQAHFAKLDPSMRQDLLDLIAEYGKPVTITSAFRTADEQRNLKDTGENPVEKPGYSAHQFGKAVDLDSKDIAALTSIKGLLQKHHFQTISGDANHLKYVPEMEFGGVAKATKGGQMVKVAEAGNDELIAPLHRGEVNVNFDEVVSVLKNILAVAKDQNYTSNKILRASV